MGKNGTKGEIGKRAKLTEEDVPELRIKNPTLEEYIYVATLAQEDKRSIPKQLSFILKDYKRLKQQES